MLENFRRVLGIAAESPPRDGSAKAAKRGLVIGELLVAFVLLAVAISSLTALMYSVTRNPRVSTQADAACVGKAAKSAACAPAPKPAARKLLVSDCPSRSGGKGQACHDSLLRAQSSDGTIIRSRTDSASLALLPQKKKRTPRPDLGFVR
jgi:hypothetical protein